jgi:hypothetical protein
MEIRFIDGYSARAIGQRAAIFPEADVSSRSSLHISNWSSFAQKLFAEKSQETLGGHRNVLRMVPAGIKSVRLSQKQFGERNRKSGRTVAEVATIIQ